MSRRSYLVDESLDAYLQAHSTPPDPIERALIAETAQLSMASMQVSPDQARLLGFLVRVSGASRIIEIGTFTGYSTLAMARAGGPDVEIVACDVSEEWTAIARRHWTAAGVADRIDLRLGPALGTLAGLSGPFDMAFIDADKPSYSAYLEAVIPLLRSGGLLVADNVLWSGAVVTSTDPDESVRALRAFNDAVAARPDLDVVLLPLFDGLTLALKR